MDRKFSTFQPQKLPWEDLKHVVEKMWKTCKMPSSQRGLKSISNILLNQALNKGIIELKRGIPNKMTISVYPVHIDDIPIQKPQVD